MRRYAYAGLLLATFIIVIPTVAGAKTAKDFTQNSTTTTEQVTTTTVKPTTTTATTSPWINMGTFESTCYGPPGFPKGQRTASGRPVGPGSIAVDPKVIPLGTRLRVSGYGEGRADDTGGAIKGRKIDVWKNSNAACKQWGRRKVTVERHR